LGGDSSPRGGGGETDGEVVRQGTDMRTEEDNAGVARSDGVHMATWCVKMSCQIDGRVGCMWCSSLPAVQECISTQHFQFPPSFFSPYEISGDPGEM
jgi:hypothetical protein